jgi:hypothetical protein
MSERDDGVRFRDEQACIYQRRYIVSLAGVSVQTRRTQRKGGLEFVWVDVGRG